MVISVLLRAWQLNNEEIETIVWDIFSAMRRLPDIDWTSLKNLTTATLEGECKLLSFYIIFQP